MAFLEVDNPASGETVCKLPLLEPEELPELLAQARRAQIEVAAWPPEKRAALCGDFCDVMLARREPIAAEITTQMGKPIAEARAEVDTTIARTHAMMDLAPEALAPIDIAADDGIERRIEKLPLGIVLDIAAWNYPLLTAVNVVVPAVLAGNAVVLKHSSRTPLVAGQFEHAFRDAGAPAGLVSGLVASHATTAELIAHEEIDYVAFTGSVAGGREVSRAARGRFIDVGLELGGKDAAYVRGDADLQQAAAGVADGAFYNAGQSCCAVERVYVDRRLHDAFVEALVREAQSRVPADPAADETRLGALAQAGHAEFLRAQIDDALSKGARLEYGGSSATVGGRGRYFECSVLSHVSHDMDLMREESFGPLAPVQAVAGDEEAIALINDSRYGLTASLWTQDAEAARSLAARIEAGSVLANRCDYVDPWLPWAGWKDSGVGLTLSALGLNRLVRTRARHFRLP